LIFLSKERIIELNYTMISKYGGSYFGENNLNNSGSLDWVLEAIQYPIFGNDLYPTLVQKASILSWIINEGHIFYDGNKRTSNIVLLIFLFFNGYTLQASKDELIQISKLIATCKTSNYSLEEYISWIEDRLIELPT